jgi:hypothetical protein
VCVLVPRSSGTPVATWAWPTWVVSRRRVLEAVFILLEFLSPSRRIFIGSHSLPPLWFAVSVLHEVAPIHRPAHRPWRAIGPRSDAHRRPCCGLSTRVCVTGVTPLAPNRPSAGIKTSPQPCLARTPNHHCAPALAICTASVSSFLRPLPWLSEHAKTFPVLTLSLHTYVLA